MAIQPIRLICAAVLIAIVGSAPLIAADGIAVVAVSSAPERVSGGDALLEVIIGGGGKFVVTANGADVTTAFKPAAQRGHFLGLVTGLKLGDNAITASQGSQTASLTLKNHPITGPMFAGPKEAPFFCETAKFKLVDGTTLGEPLDRDCSVKTVVSYVYKLKGAKDFKLLPAGQPLPADVDMTTTSSGQVVPFVVRLETGTIDRGIYQIAVLHDPTADGAPSPTHRSKNWNGKMAYLFYGGCGGMYRQGPKIGAEGEDGILDRQFLGQGYMTMSNTLNVFANNCDDLLASEAATMTHERAVKEFGPPQFTIGFGCSGGSHQVLLMADDYPGILDGIMPSCNSVDWSRMGQQAADVTLLYNWFKQPGAKGITDGQRVDILGLPLNTNSLEAVARSVASECPNIVPKDVIYNRETNPKGVRCTISEHGVNSFGRDPKTGFARNIVDNIGVQYGLGALNAGKITVAQFLDLNEQIGGFDDDGYFSKQRSSADPVGVEAAYRSGRVLNGGIGLRETAVIELRNYSDADADGRHLKYGTFATLARIERETGTRANYVVLLEGQNNGAYSATKGGDAMSHYGIKKMDDWLTAITNDKAPGTKAEKVIRDKPKDLVDVCYDEHNQRIVEEQTFSGGRCNQLYPTNAPPRMVAGTPMANDVVKCRLKAIDAADYKVKFSTAETARLKAIFPNGVCDWSKPGVGQVKPAGTWLSF